MIARDLLRYCALEALRPSSLLTADGPWPTLAGKYVADSRIDPVDTVNAEERRPIIGVFTEATELQKIAQAGPNFYSAFVDIVFELSVVQNFPDPSGSGGVIVDFADTDGAVEAALSSMEFQIFGVLHGGPTGALFRQMAKMPIESWESRPHRSGEEAIRLGRRTITVRARLKEYCIEAAPDVARTGLDRLPPALRPIAQALTGSTYISDLVAGTAAAAFVMPVRTDLDTVTMPLTDANTSTPLATPSADNLQG